MGFSKNLKLLFPVGKLFFVYADQVSSITDGVIGGSIQITLVDGAAWEEIYITPGTGKFRESSKRTSGGKLYTQMFEGWHPGEGDSSSVDFDELVSRPCIVRIGSNDGREKVVGDREYPVRFDETYQQGGKTGRGLKFVRKHYEAARWYER